jgi:hypothetical protein
VRVNAEVALDGDVSLGAGGKPRRPWQRRKKSEERRAHQTRRATSADSNRGASGEGPARALRGLHVTQTGCTGRDNVPEIVMSVQRSRKVSCDECEAWCCESTSFLVARGEFKRG